LVILNVTGLDEYIYIYIYNIGGWLKAVFLNYVLQNIQQYIYIYTHNLGYVEVVSENAINKVSCY